MKQPSRISYARQYAAQQPLERPVCGGGCVLLAQHSGKCTASNGKQWVKA